MVHFTWMFGHEEAVCKMGTEFAHNRSQESARVVTSEQCLGTFQRNSKEFLQRCVTVDKTWIHYYTPETKNQSKMWTGPGETCFFPWFCFNNEKLNSTDYNKFCNERTDLKLCMCTDIRWYSLKVVTYLR